jgi:hypothetical protein
MTRRADQRTPVTPVPDHVIDRRRLHPKLSCKRPPTKFRVVRLVMRSDPGDLLLGQLVLVVPFRVLQTAMVIGIGVVGTIASVQVAGPVVGLDAVSGE